MRAKRRRALNVAGPYAETATAERLHKAQGHVTVGQDKVTRIRDGVIDKLAAAGKLWPAPKGATESVREACAHRNRILAEVAGELHRVWRRAGLAGSPAGVDLMAPGGGSGDKAWLMPVSEVAAGARVRLRNAFAIVPVFTHSVLIGVACEDRDLVSAGEEASDETDDKGARAVARFALRHGLAALGEVWGYLKRADMDARSGR